MSKAAALEMLTGTTPAQVNASLITPDIKNENKSPGLAPKTETPSSEVIVEETKQGAPLESDRFARIAQRETKLQEERALAKKEIEEARAEREKLRPVWNEYQKFQELRKTDPMAAFKFAGGTETDFINWAAEQNKELTPEEKAIKAAQETTTQQIDAFKKEQADKELKVQQEKDNRAVTGFKQNLGKFITENNEKFEALAYQGEAGQEMVYDAVLKHIKDHPSSDEDPYTIAKEIAEIYEEYLGEEFLEMSKLKKYQEKLKGIVTPEAPKSTIESKPMRTRTLSDQKSVQKKIPSPSNSDTATVASMANTTKKESPSEKRERLIQKLANGG